METELWKKVRPFPNYEVSNVGHVRNRKTHVRLAPYLHSANPAKCYTCVTLYRAGKKRRQYLVHRLVALYHVPGRDVQKKHVHHRNGQKCDNRSTNLEWTTPHEHKALELERYLTPDDYADDPF